MAIYDYQCEKCGKVQEVERGMDEDPKITCNKKGCNGKCSHAFWLEGGHFRLKGSGWTSKGRW